MFVFYVALVVSCGSVIAFPQNELLKAAQTNPSSFEVDGFVFDGPFSRTRNSTTTTTTTAITITSLSDAQIDACVDTCPRTSEYNPICGSDAMNYTNPGMLGCAQNCGKDVTLNYYGFCQTSKPRG